MHALAPEVTRRKSLRHLSAYWIIGGVNCSSNFRNQPNIDPRRRPANGHTRITPRAGDNRAAPLITAAVAKIARTLEELNERGQIVFVSDGDREAYAVFDDVTVDCRFLANAKKIVTPYDPCADTIDFYPIALTDSAAPRSRYSLVFLTNLANPNDPYQDQAKPEVGFYYQGATIEHVDQLLADVAASSASAPCRPPELHRP